MVKLTTPLKTCTSCGQQKPLHAFSQQTGTQTVYGNICAACRQSGMEKTGEEREGREDSSTSRTEHRIDSKTKVQGEIDKRQLRKEKEDLYHEERAKDEIKQNEKWQKIDNTAQDAKKYRARAASSFLGSMPQTKTAVSAPVIAGSERDIAEKGKVNFSVPVIKVGGEEKFRSARYLEFKMWLTGSTSSTPASEQANQNTEKKEEKEKLPEFIKKTWG